MVFPMQIAMDSEDVTPPSFREISALRGVLICKERPNGTNLSLIEEKEKRPPKETAKMRTPQFSQVQNQPKNGSIENID